MLNIEIKSIEAADIIAEAMWKQAIHAMRVSLYYDMLATALYLFGPKCVEMTWDWDVNLYDDTYTMYNIKGWRKSESSGSEGELEEMPFSPEVLSNKDEDDIDTLVQTEINNTNVKLKWVFDQDITQWHINGYDLE